MNNAEVGSIMLSSASRFTTFRVPRSAIAALVPDLDAAVARRIPAGNVALTHLVGYLASALDTGALVTPELQQLAVTHVYDLLSVALGATRDATETAMGRGVRAERLRAAKAFIVRHLGRRDLNTATVAMHLGVTPRYVHLLFETEPESFSEFVLAQRIESARRTLTDPRFVGHAISTIAYAAGFNDLSHFNRTFRRRYGTTPSDVRAAAHSKSD
jgi:AraC-like DNA-binding protein